MSGDLDESSRQMGSGRIPADQIEPELRIVRHVVKTLVPTQELQGKLLQDAIASNNAAMAAVGVTREMTATATAAVHEVDKRVTQLEHDIFGNPSRPNDSGIVGDLRDTMNALRSQNWAILLAILGLIVAIAYEAFRSTH